MQFFLFFVVFWNQVKCLWKVPFRTSLFFLSALYLLIRLYCWSGISFASASAGVAAEERRRLQRHCLFSTHLFLMACTVRCACAVGGARMQTVFHISLCFFCEPILFCLVFFFFFEREKSKKTTCGGLSISCFSWETLNVARVPNVMTIDDRNFFKEIIKGRLFSVVRLHRLPIYFCPV